MVGMDLQSRGDHTLFIKDSSHGIVTSLLVYVDDIIVIEDDKVERESLKKCLAKEFEIKILDKLKYFLSIEVAYSKKGIFISQRKYILDLLKEIRSLNSKVGSTLTDPNNKIIGKEGSSRSIKEDTLD